MNQKPETKMNKLIELKEQIENLPKHFNLFGRVDRLKATVEEIEKLLKEKK